MDTNIKVGDLVMVVRNNACGCRSKYLGVPFVVAGFMLCDHCIYCGAKYFDARTAFAADGSKRIQTWRLKRLDPDALRDDAKQDDSLPTPVGVAQAQEHVTAKRT